MLSIVTVPVLMLMLGANAEDAEVVSSKLCVSQDYEEATKDCAAGKALEGSNISVTENSSVTLLSTIKSETGKDIYHVWIADAKDVKKGSKVTVFDAATNTRRDAEQADLDWLKDRKIEGAVAIVKLPVVASKAFRTRSVKTFGPKSAGNWKVQIYDSETTPIREVTFTVK